MTVNSKYNDPPKGIVYVNRKQIDADYGEGASLRLCDFFVNHFSGWSIRMDDGALMTYVVTHDGERHEREDAIRYWIEKKLEKIW